MEALAVTLATMAMVVAVAMVVPELLVLWGRLVQLAVTAVTAVSRAVFQETVALAAVVVSEEQVSLVPMPQQV